MKKENEIWKVIPNYENYEASNFGRIRSIDRVVKRDRYTTRKIKGKILQQFAKNSGYLQVNLSKNSKIEIFEKSSPFCIFPTISVEISGI